MARAFRGGAHPDDCKRFSKDAAIQDAPVPGELVVPFQQHIGKPATPVVKVNDEVLRGQVIAEAAGFVSAAVHSPVSGKIKRLVEINHPGGGRCEAALIENDGRDAWDGSCNAEDRGVDELTPEQIRERVAGAGIVGMGGATFPTHVKLSPPKDKPIDTVILNGVECEPYLTADHRLMLESPDTIVKGLRLAMRTVGARRGIIGIEANKPDAYEIMKHAAAQGGGELSVVLLPVMYPQGAEKQLIYACLKREVPSGGLPMDAGVVVQNVGTAHAIYEACGRRRPLTERVTTVTGPAVDRPGNYRVRVGTPVRLLLEHCGWREKDTRKLILGGPMMGPAHFDLDLPVLKGMSGILAMTTVAPTEYRDCIRCSRCVDGCPAGLVPSQISILAENHKYLETTEVDVLDCIECGVCTYVCPSRRPIVHWIKVSKAELARERAAKQKAAAAK